MWESEAREPAVSPRDMSTPDLKYSLHDKLVRDKGVRNSSSMVVHAFYDEFNSAYHVITAFLCSTFSVMLPCIS